MTDSTYYEDMEHARIMADDRRHEIASMISDIMPEQCQDCGDYRVDDTTPKWVYREYDVCECGGE